MKWRAALLLLMLLCLRAQALDVTFNLGDFSQGQLTNRAVQIVPQNLQPPIPTLASYDIIKAYSDTNGNLLVTNMVMGQYTVIIEAPPHQSQFMIYVPENAGGPTNAYYLTTANANNTWPSQSFAWSASASDARYLAGTNFYTTLSNLVDAAITNLPNLDFQPAAVNLTNWAGVPTNAFGVTNQLMTSINTVGTVASNSAATILTLATTNALNTVGTVASNSAATILTLATTNALNTVGTVASNSAAAILSLATTNALNTVGTVASNSAATILTLATTNALNTVGTVASNSAASLATTVTAINDTSNTLFATIVPNINSNSNNAVHTTETRAIVLTNFGNTINGTFQGTSSGVFTGGFYGDAHGLTNLPIAQIGSSNIYQGLSYTNFGSGLQGQLLLPVTIGQAYTYLHTNSASYGLITNGINFNDGGVGIVRSNITFIAAQSTITLISSAWLTAPVQEAVYLVNTTNFSSWTGVFAGTTLSGPGLNLGAGYNLPYASLAGAPTLPTVAAGSGIVVTGSPAYSIATNGQATTLDLALVTGVNNNSNSLAATITAVNGSSNTLTAAVNAAVNAAAANQPGNAALTNVATGGSNSYAGKFTGNAGGLTNLVVPPFALGDASTYRIVGRVMLNDAGAGSIHPYLSSVLNLNGVINLFFTSWTNAIPISSSTNYGRFYVKRGRTWAEVYTNAPSLVFTTNQNGMTGQFYVAGACVYSEHGTNVFDYFSGGAGGFENATSMAESECYTVDGTNFINSGNNPLTSLAGGTWHSSQIYYGPIVKDRSGLYHHFPAARTSWESTGHQTGPTMFGPWTDLTNVFMALGPTNQIVNDLVCIIPRNDGTWFGIGRGVGSDFPGSTGSKSVLIAYSSSDPNLDKWTYLGVIATPDDTGTANLDSGSFAGLYGPNPFNNAGQPWLIADDDATGLYLLAPGTLYSSVITVASNNATASIAALTPGIATNVLTNAVGFNTNVMVPINLDTAYNGLAWTWNSTLGEYTNLHVPAAGIVVTGNANLAAFNAANSYNMTIAMTNAANNFLSFPDFSYDTGDATLTIPGWYDDSGFNLPNGKLTQQIQGAFAGDSSGLTNVSASGLGGQISTTALPNIIPANSVTATNGIFDNGPATNQPLSIVAVAAGRVVTNLATGGSDGQFLMKSNTVAGGAAWVTAPGTGTVTSVAFAGDGALLNSSVSGSPITTAGTFAPSLVNASARTVWGNATGSTAAPNYTASPSVATATVDTLTSTVVNSSASVSTATVVASHDIIYAGIQPSITFTSTNLTLTTNMATIVVTNVATNVTLTLPAASVGTSQFKIINGCQNYAYVVITNANGTDVIGISNYLSYTNYIPNSSTTVQADGTNHWVVDNAVYARNFFLKDFMEAQMWLGPGNNSLTASNTTYVYLITIPAPGAVLNHANWFANATNAAIGFGVALYSPDGNTKLEDTGAVFSSTGAVHAQLTGLNGPLVPPGDYYAAWTAGNNTALFKVYTVTGYAVYSMQMDENAMPVLGTAANASANGALPSTLGTITTNFGVGILSGSFSK